MDSVISPRYADLRGLGKATNSPTRLRYSRTQQRIHVWRYLRGYQNDLEWICLEVSHFDCMAPNPHCELRESWSNLKLRSSWCARPRESLFMRVMKDYRYILARYTRKYAIVKYVCFCLLSIPSRTIFYLERNSDQDSWFHSDSRWRLKWSHNFKSSKKCYVALKLTGDALMCLNTKRNALVVHRWKINYAENPWSLSFHHSSWNSNNVTKTIHLVWTKLSD